MKLAILYFSGTGNTDYVARYLARKLDVPELEVALVPVEKQAAREVTDFDVLALGFPVYACDSPLVIRRRIEELAPGDGRGAYVFCTKGALAGNAVRRNLRRLEERGYLPLGGASVTMPGSDGLAFVGKNSWFARAALHKEYDHLGQVDRLATGMVKVVSAVSSGEPIEAFRRALPLSVTGTLFDWFWEALYTAFGAYLRGRFWADERCTACTLCARICPVDSITMRDGRPEFGDRCELCMRCIHTCPTEAIQIGRATVRKFRWHGPKGDFRPLTLRPPTGELTTPL